MKTGADGYEIITSSTARFVVYTYFKRFADKREFPKNTYTLRDVLDWIHVHSTALHTDSMDNTRELGERMLAPESYKAAKVLAGEACQYVLRVAAKYGYKDFSFDELYGHCQMLSEDAVRKAMSIGVSEGAYMRTRNDAWRLRKMSKFAERYENEQPL